MPDDDTIGRIIRRDLDRLPMLPADRWVPRAQPGRGRLPALGARFGRGALAVGAAAFLIVGALAVGSTLRALRASPVASDSQAARMQPLGICAASQDRVLGLSGIVTRLDRIAVKRMTVQDLDAGRTAGGIPPSQSSNALASSTVLCVVAVSGEIRQSFGLLDTGPYKWAVFVSVAGGDEPTISSSMGSDADWPSYFDALPDRQGSPYPGTVLEVLGSDELKVRLESAALSAEFGNPVLVKANKYTLIQPGSSTVAATGVQPGDRVSIFFEREGRNPSDGAYPLSNFRLTDAATIQPPAFDLIARGNANLQRISDLALSDTSAQHVWAIVGDAAGPPRLVHSDDGGRTWPKLPWPGRGMGPGHVAAAGSTVLVADLGSDTASNGTSATGGLYLSKDSGSTWKQVSSEAVRRVVAVPFQGGTLFLAEHFWISRGAATGPSRIFASIDGETWRQVGEVPGPAAFGAWDVPLVSFEKNVPGDGLFRIEGSDVASLRLVVVPGSTRSQGFLRGNGNDLWSFNPGNIVDPRLSVDGGRTWRVASTGLIGRIAGLFRANGAIYALGDAAYQWDGSQWRVVSILIGKAGSVFQLGDHVFVQDLPGDLWRMRPSSGSLSEFPICPLGQSPLLDVIQTPALGDQAGTGAASAEAAFKKAYPGVTDYKMYEFGTTRPYVEKSAGPEQTSSGPVWIVGNGRTFISLYIGSPGQSSWFAHPATFLGCRTSQDLRPSSPTSSPHPDGTTG